MFLYYFLSPNNFSDKLQRVSGRSGEKDITAAYLLQQRVEVLEGARVTLERVSVVVISAHRCFEPESRIHRLALYKRWLELHPGFYHVSGICRHQPQG